VRIPALLIALLLFASSPLTPRALADDEDASEEGGEGAAEEPEDDRNLAERRPVQLSLGAYAGLAERSGSVEGIWMYGLGFGVTIAPVASLRVVDIAVGFDTDAPEGIGTVLWVRAAPVFELQTFFAERVSLYGQVGVDLVFRTESQFARSQDAQIAGLLTGGFRFWLLDMFSLDVELDVTLTLTDRYEAGFGSPVQQPGEVAGRLSVHGSLHF
jgi:hypothetical protein